MGVSGKENCNIVLKRKYGKNGVKIKSMFIREESKVRTQNGKGTIFRKKQISWEKIFPWVWMIAAYCITFAVLALYGRPYIDSDMSSEMILADLLNQEGGLLSTNWWYSTELRVVYLQLFYRIGLIIFPQNWYAARVLGQALVMAVLLATFLYVGHGLKLKGNGIWGAAALACPFGVWYFWYGAFGGAYLPPHDFAPVELWRDITFITTCQQDETLVPMGFAGRKFSDIWTK